MQLYAVVDSSGNVVNTIMWDGTSALFLPTGQKCVLIKDGYGVVNGKVAKLPAIVPVTLATTAKEPIPAYVNDADARDHNLPDYSTYMLTESGYLTQLRPQQ